MPTYQYACTECDHAFEQVQSFSDDALTVCPQCEGRLRKVYGAVGVVFKGSGFYRTDSRGTPSEAGSSKDSVSGSGKESAAKDSGSKDAGSSSSGSTDSGTTSAPKKDSSSSSGSGGSKAPAAG